jgi:hypothetical protein
MEQFRDARCVNPRDKVFALRGIANDGFRLLPNYTESVADVFFRVLSMLPTERFCPGCHDVDGQIRLQFDCKITCK